MSNCALAPDARLAPFVESLWIQDEAAVPAGEAVEPTVVLPAGRAALVLEYGDPYEECGADGRWRRLPPLALQAQRSSPARVNALGRTGLVIVNFHAWGAEAFFGPQEEFAESFADAGALLAPASVVRVREELALAADASARRAAVERLLLARLPHRGPDRLVVAAVERIRHRVGRERVEVLAGVLGISRRQLARRFASALGIAPKTLARIVRFQEALRRARAGESWATLAPAVGFHDQAHLVKECRELSGRTPGELLPHLDERDVGRFYNDADPRLRRYATYL